MTIVVRFMIVALIAVLGAYLAASTFGGWSHVEIHGGIIYHGVPYTPPA